MQQILEYVSDLKLTLDKLPAAQIDQIISTLNEARHNGKQIFIFANGESASAANQLVCDLSKNTRQAGWPGFKVIGLSENLVLFSAYASDDGMETVFANQMDALLNRGDIAVCFSNNGNESNIIRAVELANRRGATTIGFSGARPGRLASILDISLAVPAEDVEFVQDLHHIICHIITRRLREDAQQTRAASQLERLYPEATVSANPRKTQEADIPRALENQLSERSRNSLELFSSISRELALELELGELLRRVLKLTLYNLRATSGSILVLNQSGQVIESALAYNGDVSPTSAGQTSEIVEKGLAGWVVQNRKAALIYNTRDDPRWLPRTWDREGKSRSAVSVPLIENEKVLGVLTLVNSQGGRFTEEDLSLLATIAVFMSLVNYSV